MDDDAHGERTPGAGQNRVWNEANVTGNNPRIDRPRHAIGQVARGEFKSGSSNCSNKKGEWEFEMERFAANYLFRIRVIAVCGGSKVTKLYAILPDDNV